MSRYVGSELELFSIARHWKRYLICVIAPFIGTRMLVPIPRWLDPITARKPGKTVVAVWS